AAPGPIYRVCSTRATCRIARTGRPSPRRARAAWRRWKRSGFWKRKAIEENERMSERIIPPGGPTPRGPYSPAVRAGDFIYVAGQGPVDAATNQMSFGDIKHETRIVLTNIQRILEGCGASMADVVKCSVFLRNGSDFAAMNEVYAEFFGAQK